MLPALFAAVAASIGYGTASVLEAVAARRATGARVFTQPIYLLGITLDLLAWAASLYALQFLTVFTVQALLAGSLVVTVLLARWVFATALGAQALAAMGLLVLGLVVIALSTGEQPAGGAPAGLVPVLAAVLVLLLAVLGACYRRRAPLLFAALAGLAASAAALAARSLDLSTISWGLLADPLPWIIAVSGVLAMVSYTRALEQGSVGPMTALYTVIEVLVPGIAGMVLLGDAARPGWEAAKFSAIALSLTAGVWLALRGGADALQAATGAAPAQDDNQKEAEGMSP